MVKKKDHIFRVIIKQEGKDGKLQEMQTRIRGDHLLQFLSECNEIMLAGLLLKYRLYDLVVVKDQMIVGFGLERKCFIFDCENKAEHGHHGIITKAMVRGVKMTRPLRLVIDGKGNLFRLCARCHEGRGHISRTELFRNHCRHVGYDAARKHWEQITGDAEQHTVQPFRRIDYAKFEDIQIEGKANELPF
jgi:hypothetical protein